MAKRRKPQNKQASKPTEKTKSPPVDIPKARPTESELSALWDVLAAKTSNRFSTDSINKSVDKLVAKGKIRPQAAPSVKSYAVFGEDLIRWRDEPIDPQAAARGLEERYFLGGQQEAETPRERELLREARAAQRPDRKLTPMDRPKRSLGIPDSEEQLIRRSLQTPAGKKLAEATINYQRRSEGRPRPKNPLARLRPKSLRTTKEKPYEVKGSTLAEKMMRAKVVGKGVGTRATTKSGKPIFFKFKDSDRGRYYKPDVLEKVLGPEDSDVLSGVAPLSKTAYAKLNEAAKKGSNLAALLLAKLKSSNFKLGERVEKAGMTTREGRVFFDKKTGTFKPIFRKNRAGEIVRGPDGKPVQATEIRTPETKEKKRARTESRNLGRTAREEATSTRFRDPSGRTQVEQVGTVEGSIAKGVEERVRKGKSGPFTARDTAILKKLQEKELASYDPELLADMKIMSRIRTRPDEPKTSREISDEMAALRAERNPSKRVRMIQRLDQILRARGLPTIEQRRLQKESEAPPTSDPRMVKLPGPGPSRMGKARRKPVHLRPGKGPGIKETAFAILAKRFGR